MLISDDNPFREVMSQLPVSEVHSIGNLRVPTLCTYNGLVVIGPELFENEDLEPRK